MTMCDISKLRLLQPNVKHLDGHNRLSYINIRICPVQDGMSQRKIYQFVRFFCDSQKPINLIDSPPSGYKCAVYLRD